MAQGSTNANEGTKKILFCPYCGSKLSEDSQYCSNCGERIISSTGENPAPDKTNFGASFGAAGEAVSSADINIKNESKEIDKGKSSSTDSEKRKIIYEGDIHKCPNCGEVLDAFVTRCPSCGYELRGAKSVTSLQALSAKLEEISSRKMPDNSGKQSGKIIVTGRATKKRQEAVEQARKDFEEQKNNEKASLISNFAVPNTKEDILEFTIMAAANIDTKEVDLDTVSKAWLSKLEQVYQKAELTLAGQPELVQIKRIYDNKMKDVKATKAKTPIFALVFFGILLTIIGFGIFSEGGLASALPFAGIGILLLAAGLVIFIRVFIVAKKED